MKLLIVTQKVDKNDDVLGFFHGWIKEFAKHFEKITIICLGKGEYDLPKNVKVLSLGKEKEENQESRIKNQGKNAASLILDSLFLLLRKIRYIVRLYRFIWKERNNYDAIFVHMNQEYILLGGVLWKLMGKTVTMWRNHYAGNFLTRIAMALSDKIFCTSQYSFTARSKKTVFMPVGIDTEFFKKEENIVKKPNSVLFLARMSPAKKPHLLIEALRILRDEGIRFSADFYGNSISKDAHYLKSLKEKVKAYSLDDRITFEKGIANTETPRVYGTHTAFINSSPSGMYDKTIFEAMACESLVLVSNLNLKGKIDDRFLFREDDAEDLARELKTLLSLGMEAREEYGKILRTYAFKEQSLELLAQRLFNELP